MPLRSYIFTILISLSLVSGFSQDQNSLLYDAYDLYKTGEFVAAGEIIDRVVNETEDSVSAEAWAVRAFIYYEIFAKIDQKSVLSAARVVSLSSALKTIELDKSKEFELQIKQLLERISVSYYNDAVMATKDYNPDDPKFAENSYLEYKRIQKIIYPNKNFDETDKNFYKAEATLFAKIWETDPLSNKDEFNLTIDALLKVLKIDSLDAQALFNISVYYYNEAVYEIQTIGTSTNMEKLLFIQEYGMIMFKKALPYMLKAHKINPREETLRGLKGIYNALNEPEKFEYYSRELDNWLEEHKQPGDDQQNDD